MGHSDVVKELIIGGADPNIQNEVSPETQYLQGTSLPSWMQEGLTALMVAVKEGNTSLVQVLIGGTDLNVQENVRHIYSMKYVCFIYLNHGW